MSNENEDSKMEEIDSKQWEAKLLTEWLKNNCQISNSMAAGMVSVLPDVGESINIENGKMDIPKMLFKAEFDMITTAKQSYLLKMKAYSKGEMKVDDVLMNKNKVFLEQEDDITQISEFLVNLCVIYDIDPKIYFPLSKDIKKFINDNYTRTIKH